MELRQVLRGIEWTGGVGLTDTDITGVVCDSRKVRRGSLFVCIRGYTTDGHRFAAQAAEQGAAALVVDRPVDGVLIPQCVVRDTREALALVSRNFYDDPCGRMSVIGVTGTAGKTSISFLFRHLMETAGKTTGLIGPVANIVRGMASFSVRSTPEANDLLALLDEMASTGTSNAVMEVSSQGIRMGRIDGCSFSTGVFSNLYSDFVGMTDPPTFREAFDSKIHFARLCRHIVVNRDAEHAEAFLARLNKPALTYGLNANADIRAEALTVEWRGGRCGTRFMCRSPWYEGEIFVGLPGRFHVSNALAALTCAALAGVDPGKVVAAFAQGTVPGCMEPVEAPPGIGAYVDTARNPQTLERMLIALRVYSTGRVTVVFGCDGNTSASTRAAMGRVAALGADKVVLVPDNPYLENPSAITKDIEAGFPEGKGRPVLCDDRAAGIRTAVAGMRAGDSVVVAGKGHRKYQMYASRTEVFNDVEHLRQAFADLRKDTSE